MIEITLVLVCGNCLYKMAMPWRDSEVVGSEVTPGVPSSIEKMGQPSAISIAVTATTKMRGRFITLSATLSQKLRRVLLPFLLLAWACGAVRRLIMGMRSALMRGPSTLNNAG